MANVENRPYAGNWRLNQTQVVKVTPDLLVYINGDLTIPGCPSCNGRINVQEFVTAASIDAGVDPTSHSASITLSLPKVQGEQAFVDGKNILRPGLEVHIFMRGYFPVQGQFQHLTDQQGDADDEDQLAFDLTKYASFPYYPVFHGVVTQSVYEYSDGFYTGSLSCASLLHFWQYQNITSNAAFFGARPRNSPGKSSLFGHNFNNMHPYGIIYTLYRDTAGAAMAVEFALDEQSNIDAVTSDGSQQLFDQVALYWEQRFKTRVFSLRMYGVNGQLFNAAQQAFLSSASNRDLEKLLSNNIYSDPETTRSESDPFSSRFSVAKALGLAGGGLDLTYAPFINQDGEPANLSILDMFAFNQDIAEVGTVQLFETTYQTKMEVAQQVQEVTGFELYQDVDGDLVFKPPFYNLDTSTNRFYRLEDIDIISMNCTEKEPEATYISVRGSWFKGLTGVVPNTGATGKRGLYIDYKLVAQFGWRPASLEVSYTTDPRILFYVGMARLDRLNVDVNSATATIPYRPELRPGYPVYVPFLDCYYYLQSFSHSFAFGAQCTTSLNLTCRRAKFNPPAEFGEIPEGKSAIDLVRLDRPDFPRRRIEGYNKEGIPRNFGFPNVVLALDPAKANPQFFPVGAGLDFITSEERVEGLFQYLREDIAAQTPQIFEVAQQYADDDGRVLASVPTEEVTYLLRLGNGETIPFNLEDLKQDFGDLQSIRQSIQDTENALRSKQNEVQALIQKENTLQDRGSNRAAAEQELLRLTGQLQNERERLQAEIGDEGSANQNKLVAVVTALQKFRGSPARRKIDGLPGSDVKATYFDTLLNLKSQYMLDDLPGRYRYYSCSHPDPAQQGQPVVLFDDGDAQRSERPVTGSTQVSANDAAPIPAPEDGLPANPRLRLNAKLALAGIDWIRANALSATRLISLGLIPPGSSKGSKGALQFARNSTENLTEEISNNIANIAEAANRIRMRLLDNPRFQELGFSLGSGSIWRLAGVINESEALHSTGKALDFGLRPSKKDSINQGRLSEFQEAFDLLKAECLRAYGMGEVNFVRIYENRSNKPTTDFVHIDQRTQEDVDFFRSMGRNTGFGYSFDQDGESINGTPYDTPAGRQAERERLAQVGGFDFNTFFTNNRGFNDRRQEQQFRRSPAGRSFPIPENPSSNNPPQPAPPVAEAAAPVPLPESPTRISFRDVALDPPRQVVQFKKDPRTPPGLRPAQAELALGPCTRGFNVAQGPGRTPQVLTTDQIQTVSFVQYNSSKFANVVGVSQTTGQVNINAQSLFAQISRSFEEAVQDVQDVDQTPNDVFSDLYNSLASDISQVEIPNYQNGVSVQPALTVNVPAFEDAVPSVPVTPSLESQFSGTAIPIATTSFRQLSIVPGYSTPMPKEVDSQTISGTIEKVANAYAQSLAKTISDAFQSAKQAASTPKEGKSTRLGTIEVAFRQITRSATGQEAGAQSLLSDTKQSFVPQSSKSFRGKFVPVFPVSDEKGYEHYGAYRYGRGLTIEQGGTFEFLHSDGDPFQNIDAQSAEEFLRALTLVKSQSRLSDSFETLREGIRDGEVDSITKAIRDGAQVVEDNVSDVSAVVQNAFSDAPGAEVPPDVRAREAALANDADTLDRVFDQLQATPQGTEAIRALLEGNGDDPNLIQQDNFDITQTQFARNFSNYSANYAKSGVFKTTVANAAYRLADLNSHILDRVGSVCRCRGAQADVELAAYGRVEFVTVEDLDSSRDPATAAVSEIILQSAGDYFAYMRQVRGSFQSDNPSAPDFSAIFGTNFTKAFQTTNANLAGGFAPGIFTVLPGNASTSQPPTPNVDAELPPDPITPVDGGN